MKTLKTFLNSFRGSSHRFDRYYAGVLREGSGFPTADEAKRDMHRQNQATRVYEGWLR